MFLILQTNLIGVEFIAIQFGILLEKYLTFIWLLTQMPFSLLCCSELRDYKLCMATALKCSALAAPVISARRHNVSRKSYLCLVSCHRGGRDTHHHLLHHTARAVPPPSNEFLSSLAWIIVHSLQTRLALLIRLHFKCIRVWSLCTIVNLNWPTVLGHKVPGP